MYGRLSHTLKCVHETEMRSQARHLKEALGQRQRQILGLRPQDCGTVGRKRGPALWDGAAYSTQVPAGKTKDMLRVPARQGHQSGRKVHL